MYNGGKDMSNELMIIEAAKGVSNVLGPMVSLLRQRKINREEYRVKKALLEERIKTYKAVAHAQAMVTVFDAIINEIERAQRLIDSAHLSGASEEAAKDLLRVLNDRLIKILEDFSR